METWSNKETMFFNPETGKLSPVKTDDKAVAVSMAADGFFFSHYHYERVCWSVSFGSTQSACSEPCGE